MTFKELYEEAARRGFTDLLEGSEASVQLARLKRYVNAAHREVVDAAPWPFLRATTEGTAPLTIADLGHILSVSNLADQGQVWPMDERQITQADPAREQTGSAQEWYRESLTKIGVWPLDTTSKLFVRYVKRATKMTADSDEPLVPEEYQELIVDGTVVRLYKNRDNFEAGQFVRQEWANELKGMKHALLKPNYDREMSIVRTGARGDYLG